MFSKYFGQLFSHFSWTYLFPNEEAINYYNHFHNVSKLIDPKYAVENAFLNEYLSDVNILIKSHAFDAIYGRKRFTKERKRIYFIYLVFIFNSIKWMLLISIDLDQKSRIIQGDITPILGGDVRYSLLCCSLAIFYGTVLFYSFNFCDPKNIRKFKWTKLFEVISGRLAPQSIGLENDDGIWLGQSKIIIIFI
jgi:hypothetical protein